MARDGAVILRVDATEAQPHLGEGAHIEMDGPRRGVRRPNPDSISTYADREILRETKESHGAVPHADGERLGALNMHPSRGAVKVFSEQG
jgi:hypothetical protein